VVIHKDADAVAATYDPSGRIHAVYSDSDLGASIQCSTNCKDYRSWVFTLVEPAASTNAIRDIPPPNCKNNDGFAGWLFGQRVNLAVDAQGVEHSVSDPYNLFGCSSADASSFHEWLHQPRYHETPLVVP
jgi:hypothetical protein